MSLATFYRASSPYKTNDANPLMYVCSITKFLMKLLVNEFVKLQKQLRSTAMADQKNLNAVKRTSGCQIPGIY